MKDERIEELVRQAGGLSAWGGSQDWQRHTEAAIRTALAEQAEEPAEGERVIPEES